MRTNQTALDSATIAVMANRMDGICRQMTNTLLRAGRSSVLALARDFSCSIVTENDELLAAAEGLPVHVIGSEFLAESMTELHPDIEPGDAYLHNDPYMGNTHHADHSILVPVFLDGVHIFTAVAKAHQADCGNALPTTYMAEATDIYAEGAISFPCVRIQRDYTDVADIVRMCKRRIRAPETWYGDYLATLGAARVGERELRNFAKQYGIERIRDFVKEWLDYSERRMEAAIRELPAQAWVAHTSCDPFPGMEEGLELKAELEIDNEAGYVSVDLSDNPDCVPNGLNQSRTCSLNNAMTGVMNCLDPQVPRNGGSFRRIQVTLRENCVVGEPLHPTSCSVATTNIGDRLVNMIQSSFATVQDGLGLAQGAMGFPPERGAISGRDQRDGRDTEYVTQLIVGTSGGPGSPVTDGWVTYTVPVGAGLLYRDSVEALEQKYPMLVDEVRVRVDSEGAGRQRGAPGCVTTYGPYGGSMHCHYSLDGRVHPPTGVRGGGPAIGPEVYRITADGEVEQLEDTVGAEVLGPGEKICSYSAGGGGYGAPEQRLPERVLRDLTEGYISIERAESVYRVAVDGDPARPESLVIDTVRTEELRAGAAGTRSEKGGG